MFCRAVVEATRTGLNVEAKDTQGYTYKTVARKVITTIVEPGDIRLAASSDDATVWDGLQMKEITEWMPDQGNYLRPLETLSGAEARRLFAMPPPWIGCFACYCSALTKPQIGALQRAKCIDVLLAIERFTRDHGYAPSLMTVANALM